MLNEKLFDDPKDAEIARLKMLIERFKEYDEKRKRFYAAKMQRLGELETYVLEIDTETEIGKLKETILKLRTELNHYAKLVQAYKIEQDRTDEELSEVITIENLKRRNKYLNTELSRLRCERSRQITESLKQKRDEQEEIREVD